MPGIKDVIRGMRNKDKSSKRVLELTPEELKTIPDDGSGEEVCVSVYGTLSDSGFDVNRVEPEQDDEPDESESEPGPSNRAMPVPS